jgi:hypothetical protein
MTDLERDATEPEAEASELEGGGTGQSWGQGEGAHEPTIPDADEEETPVTYSDGAAAALDDPAVPLAREDEGMDR